MLAFQPSDLAAQSASLQIVINPLVDWIWFGFAVMAIGTGIALLPERTFAFAMAKLPEAATAATTTVALLLVLWLSSAPLLAQMAPGTGIMLPPKNALEGQMRDEMACICGGCEHEALSKCPCGQRRPDARRAAGADRSGQDARGDHLPLHRATTAVSISSGCRSTRGSTGWRGWSPTWCGATGLVVVGMTARRWSRKRDDAASEPSAPTDPALEERLDDELRNLD